MPSHSGGFFRIEGLEVSPGPNRARGDQAEEGVARGRMLTHAA
jgi:hypothetical protein